MFYSEQLLTKTGPLAKVWLASNVERKLSKSQILQSDITNSVHVIVDQGQAPMALRMSGQLMLGVVRIYGRKARYLLDDCNEALLKIRMTFKSTNNHDLPHQTTTTIDLNLPEQLTIDDLFPALDFGFPLIQQPATQDNQRAIDYDEDWTSSLNPHTQTETSGLSIEGPGIHDDDLGLDLGDIGMEDTTVSIQVGRGEATPRPDEPTEVPVYDDGDDLGLDVTGDVPMPDTTMRIEDEPIPGIEEDQPLVQLEDETAQLREATAEQRESPLSEADPEFMEEYDRTFAQQQEEVEEVVAQQRPASRRVKPMVADRETTLHNSEMKAFSEDRSKILQPLSFLPQDPELLALINMQRNGEFVTNAMNDGISNAWAPEIQGLLSFEVVYRSGQKRKRDSGIADVVSEDGHSDKSPRLERSSAQVEEQMIEDEGVEIEDQPLPEQPIDITETHEPVEPADPTLADIVTGEDEEGITFGEGGFDDTTAPLVHPADSGPISVATQHVVHLLRDVFGSSPAADSPSSQSRKSVLLQDLIPEGRTTKEDATKMFFETLVLATKDAIKVEQSDKEIGLPIRVRAKRGLWGAWAEPSQGVDAPGQEVDVAA
ncbi:sister chromatid cohesion protein 1 [Neophaeococcomyces mojaviensis]|uniref:Sister chromatid cohesion protein 1 n=1 Tax=Neophaeococcomyces mojaviensis TaxID=3383035 RepID=A0ACC3A6A4_9EURO|nr:sister chromatid cohesion protein 1 [Knufia sp. JES_112]